MPKIHDFNEKIGDKIVESKHKKGAAAGAIGAGVAARGGSNALVAANGVLGGHVMKASVNAVGAQNTAVALRYAGGANAATIILPIGLFGYDFACDVGKYWKGEIDGVDLAENTTKNLATLAAGGCGGYGGAVIGAEVGMWAGPISAVAGAVIGAVVGGISAAWVGNSLAEESLKRFFGGSCDKRSMLRKSFRVLGLDQNASNEEIRKRYLALCKNNHPDKGGDNAKFVEINAAYEIIRASQGQRNRR